MSEFFKKMISNITLTTCIMLVAALATQSCKKPLEDPKAEITIVDSTGTAIADAKVILFCVQRADVSVECNIADTQYTDGVGKVNFDFTNPSVLRVSVLKYNTEEREIGVFPDNEVIIVGDTLCADGFITLESNEVTEEVFVLGKCESN
jgi:hypothetical protein